MHKLVDFLTYILQLGEAGASGLSYLSLSFGLLDCTILWLAGLWWGLRRFAEIEKNTAKGFKIYNTYHPEIWKCIVGVI